MLRRRLLPLDVKIAQWSFRLWPYGMARLGILAIVATRLDYMSTYYALELSGKPIMESRALARYLLELGGWQLLLIKDLVAPGIYAVIAFAIYQLSALRDMTGLGRFLAVTMLEFYLLWRVIPAISNIVLSSI